LQVSGQAVEDSRHVSGALDIGVAAQRIHAASSATYIAQQQLQHGRGANDLSTESVLRPSHSVNNSADLFHVAIFADRSEKIGGFQELVFGNTCNTLDHLWRVARVLLLE